MEIKSTTDYSLFKKLEGNRDIKKTNALVASINEMNLTKFCPIIVDEAFRIVDGQHRFDACQRLDLPVYFVVMESQKAEQAMIILNKCQSQWRNEEFFQYNEKSVGGCYTELKEYIEKYKIPLSFAVLLFPEKPFDTRKIRSSDFKFTKYKFCDDLAEYYTSHEFRKLPFSKSKPFARAIRIFYENSTERERKKLLLKALAIPQCANYNQYLTAFKNLIRMRR